MTTLVGIFFLLSCANVMIRIDTNRSLWKQHNTKKKKNSNLKDKHSIHTESKIKKKNSPKGTHTHTKCTKWNYRASQRSIFKQFAVPFAIMGFSKFRTHSNKSPYYFHWNRYMVNLNLNSFHECSSDFFLFRLISFCELVLYFLFCLSVMRMKRLNCLNRF